MSGLHQAFQSPHCPVLAGWRRWRTLASLAGSSRPVAVLGDRRLSEAQMSGGGDRTTHYSPHAKPTFVSLDCRVLRIVATMCNGTQPVSASQNATWYSPLTPRTPACCENLLNMTPVVLLVTTRSIIQFGSNLPGAPFTTTSINVDSD